jgi:hypothetical protein
MQVVQQERGTNIVMEILTMFWQYSVVCCLYCFIKE